MRILHLATQDVSGGAARAAHRLHRGLLGLGHDSRMLVLERASTEPTVARLHPDPGIPARLRRKLRRRAILADLARYDATRPPGYERFSDDRSEWGPDLVRQLPECDVVNLHWVGSFVDYRDFFGGIPARLPVVWTLHDMNPFTGGCHYDDGCGRFVARCGACPQLGSRSEGDLSRQVWRRKREALAGRREGGLQVVADSEWLAGEARRSSLFAGLPVTTIYYGLDTEVFSPRPRNAARAVLGIPEDAAVVMFAADSVENRRKGFPYLLEALAGLGDVPGLFLLSLGRGAPPVPESLPRLHFEHVGSDHVLSILYSAADVFVIPSLQEAYGQTALEAMACGTPVAGFDVGGIPEVVRPGITGLLAPRADVPGLRDAIVRLLADRDEWRRMSEVCRRTTVEEHGLEVQARRYLGLYGTLVGGVGAAAP